MCVSDYQRGDEIVPASTIQPLPPQQQISFGSVSGGNLNFGDQTFNSYSTDDAYWGRWKDPRPQVTASFVGRQREYEQLLRLHHLVSSGTVQLPTSLVIVQGHAGSGKSQLCSKFFEESHKSSSYAYHWWISANQGIEFHKTLYAAMQECHSAFYSCNPPSSAEPGQALDSIRHMLGSLERPWLLTIDGAIQDIKTGITRLVPPRSRGLVVVNSQKTYTDILERIFDPDNRSTSTQFALTLEGIDESAATHLLRSHTHPRYQSEEWTQSYHEIALRLCYSPLAVDLAGAYIKHQRIKPTEYFEKFDENWDLALRDPEGTKDPTKAVYAAYQRSIDAVKETLHGHEGKFEDVLRILSFYLPERVPTELISQAVVARNNPQRDWIQTCLESLGQTCVIGSWDAAFWTTVTSRLEDFHLIKKDSNNSGATFSVHSLLLSWTFTNLVRTDHEKRQEALRWNAIVLLSSARVSYPGRLFSSDHLLAPLLPHLRECLTDWSSHVSWSVQSSTNTIHLDRLKILCRTDHPVLAQLLFEVAEILKAGGDVKDTERLMKNQQRTLMQRGQIKSTAYLRSQVQYGSILTMEGKYQSAHKHLASLLDAQGSEKPGTADLSRLSEILKAKLAYAESLARLSRWNEALHNEQEALNIVMSGDWDTLTKQFTELMILGRISNRNFRLGHLQEAIEMQYRVRDGWNTKIRRSLSVPAMIDANTLLASILGYGTTLQRKEAAMLREQIIEDELSLQTALGIRDEWTDRLCRHKDNLGSSYCDIALQYGGAERESWLRKARDQHELVLIARVHRHGDHHPYTWATRAKIAKTKIFETDTSLRNEAIEELTACAERARAHFGVGCIDFLVPLNLLALALYRSAQAKGYADFLLHRRQALELRIISYELYVHDPRFGLHHPETLHRIRQLAESLHECYSFETELAFRLLLSTALKDVSHSRDRTWDAQYRAAQSLAESDICVRMTEAEQVFQQLLTDAPSEDEPDFVASGQLIELLIKANKLEDAKVWCDRTVSRIQELGTGVLPRRLESFKRHRQKIQDQSDGKDQEVEPSFEHIASLRQYSKRCNAFPPPEEGSLFSRLGIDGSLFVVIVANEENAFGKYHSSFDQGAAMELAANPPWAKLPAVKEFAAAAAATTTAATRGGAPPSWRQQQLLPNDLWHAGSGPWLHDCLKRVASLVMADHEDSDLV